MTTNMTYVPTSWVGPEVDEEKLREVAQKYRTPEPEQIQTLRKRTKTGYVDLRYTSHATVTTILNEIDPAWEFEFVTDKGIPVTVEKNDTLTAFGYLTILGKRILAVGSCEATKAEWAKELYGDCLVAGTMITTARGDIPIEDVEVGDLVYNRRGLFPVTDHWLSSPQAPVVRVTFDDGRTLVGTPHHRVPTQRGDVHLGELEQGDELWVGKSRTPARSLSSTVGSTSGTQTHLNGSIVSTTGRHAAEARAVNGFSIETSGSTTTVLCRMDTTSITSTMTPSTTTSPTLQSCLRQIIHSTTGARSLGTSGSATVVALSTSSPEVGHGSAMSTARSLNNGQTARSRFGLRKRQGGSPAPSAGRSSTRTNPGRDSVGQSASSGATARVARVEPAGTAEVWNLSVGLVHEYYANGLAVSNCLRNAAMRAGIHIALWDKDFPEAEQKAKEAKQKSAKAQLDADLATVRKVAAQQEKQEVQEAFGQGEKLVTQPARATPDRDDQDDQLAIAVEIVTETLGATLATPPCGTQPERFSQWDAVPGCGSQVEEVDDKVVRITKTYLCNSCLGKWRASTGAKEE